jgi:hypothetical protein
MAITVPLRVVINFVDGLTALRFTANNAVHAWEFFMMCQQLAEVISSISHLFSITTTEQSVPSW